MDGLSFEVESGQSVALWGENGAGKTTALRCLLGVIPYQGQVLLGGHDTAKDGKAARRLMGFVPQEISFHDDLTAWETLNFYYRLKKTSTGKEYVVQMLERLGLAAYTGKRVRDLSGGMKQRLALVIALLADPPLLILDEPTANLDVKAREEFLALLTELKDQGKTRLLAESLFHGFLSLLKDRGFELHLAGLINAMDIAEGRCQKVARPFDATETAGNLEHVFRRRVEFFSCGILQVIKAD